MIEITEKQVTEYRITHKFQHQKITISEFKNGAFEFASSGGYGPYAHYWGAPGSKGWLHFLDACDDHYLMGKLCNSRVFDSEETVKSLKNEIIDQRRDQEMSREEARMHWDILTDAEEVDNIDLFLHQLISDHLWNIEDTWEYLQMKYPDSLVGFMRIILRPFIAEMLKRQTNE